MSSVGWLPNPTREDVLRFTVLFTVTAAIMYFVSFFAWRLALRDTNVQKRMRILRELGVRESRKFINAGGGGERVLFEAIRVHQKNPDAICVVYTGDIQPLPNGVTKEEILAKAKERFGIELRSDAIAFLPLQNRQLVDGTYWRHFTLLGQAYGADRLGYQALSELVPDVFIDTMGYAFSLAAVKNYSKNVRVGAYIHYPTISTDMLQRVRNRQVGHTNSGWIATSYPLSLIKLIYYHLFAAAYANALRNADVIVVNGTWTRNHIQSLLRPTIWRPWTVNTPPVNIVYPPCNTEQFSKLPLTSRQTRHMVSLAQFRPEKEHSLQLRLLHKLLNEHGELKSSNGPNRAAKLVLIGSCRNIQDESRVEELKALAKELVIEKHVEWCINASLETVLKKLRSASVGLSTMVDEHFGINVVEYMASGLLTLSHASAGPLLDIAVPVDGEPTGFHAKDLDDYAAQAYKLFNLQENEALAIRERARTHVQTTFSDRSFEMAWCRELWDRLVPQSLLQLNEELKKNSTLAIKEIKDKEPESRIVRRQHAKAVTSVADEDQ